MSSKMKNAQPRMSRLLSKLMRSTFQVESLEQRILLSADPVTATAQMLLDRNSTAIRYEIDPVNQGHAEAVLDADSETSFHQVLNQTRSLVMESVFAVQDQAYSRFMEGVLDSDALGGDQLSGAESVTISAVSDSTLKPQAVSSPSGDAQAWMPQDAIDTTKQPASDYLLDGGRYDAAQLARDVSLVDMRSLVVAPGSMLAGSGSLQAPVEVLGILAPGYSPGVANFTNGLTLDSGSTTVIELGGMDPGTGYDQINVAGGATLNGKLQVSLHGGFKPKEGDTFTFINYDSVSGSFDSAQGLVDAANGIYYEIKQNTNSIQLVAHKVDTATAFLISALDGSGLNGLIDDDVIGMAMNPSYFMKDLSYDVSGSLALGSGLSLSGSMFLGYQSDFSLGNEHYSAWRLGLENASGYFGSGPQASSQPGLSIADLDLGLLWLDSTSSDQAWIWAQGSAANISLKGVGGISLSTDSLTIDFAQGIGAGNDTMLDLSAASTSVSVGATNYVFESVAVGERSTLSGNVNLIMPAHLTLSGRLGIATSDAGLLMAGSSVSSRLDAGGMTVGLDSAQFGLVILADSSGFELEAKGAIAIIGAGFSSVSADSALLRVNTTGVAQAARTLSFGNFTYTLAQMDSAAVPVLQVTGLNIMLGDAFKLSGNFAFQRESGSGDLQALASSASAQMQAGNLSAGVNSTKLALVVSAATAQQAGGVLLEAEGGLSTAFDSSVSLSASQAAVRWNSTGNAVSGRKITIADEAYTFGKLDAGVQQIAVSGAQLTAGEFFRVNGDFALLRSTVTVKLAGADASDGGILSDLITIGAQGLAATAGISDSTGLQLTGVQFGLALMSARADASRRWTSLQATASTAQLNGLAGVKIAGADLNIAFNDASKTGDAVVDYAAGKTVLNVSTGVGSSLALSMDGNQGRLLQASGHLTVEVQDFVRTEGNYAIQRSTQNLKLSDGSSVSADMLTLGASGAELFAGVDDAAAGAIGLELSGVEFGLALMSDRADATRSWVSLQSNSIAASLIGVQGLTLSAGQLCIAVNQATRVGDAVVHGLNSGLLVSTGSSKSIALALDGLETLEARGAVTVEVADFVTLSGD
ncbi:hypothetical protein C6P61_16980, partial [Malikia spinosa]